MYDFEKYYTDMDIKAETNIDLSGVQIENPQGNPNEHVTNNVVYYVTGILVSNDAGFPADGSAAVGLNDRLQVIVTEDASTSYYYAALLHPLSDIIDSGVASTWDPGKNRIYWFDLDTSGDGMEVVYRVLHDAIGTYTDYSCARVFVAPRYEFITNDPEASDVLDLVSNGTMSPLKVNQNVISEDSVSDLPRTMRAIYMMLGLNGKRKVSRKAFRKNLKNGGKYRAVIGYDLFRKRIGQISEWCLENNYGVDVKYYDRSMAEEIPDYITDATVEDYAKDPRAARAKHRTYVAAEKYADRTRTSMSMSTSFNEAYGNHLRAFLANPRVSPLIDRFTPSDDGVTALIPPLKDAVKGVFYPREEIENEFYENFERVYTGMQEALRLMEHYLSPRTRGRISGIRDRYTNRKSDDGALAFDMASLMNMVKENFDALVKSYPGEYETGYSGYAIGNTLPPGEGYSSGVTAYPRVFQVNGQPAAEIGNVVSSWAATPIPNRGPNDLAIMSLHYVNGSTGDYRSENFAWNKATVDMGAEEVREFLVEVYNWLLDSEGYPTLQYGVDFQLDDHSFDNGYADGSDSDFRIRQCKRFIQFVGGWMNLFRNCGTKEGVWTYVAAHPVELSSNPNLTIWGWVVNAVESGAASWNLNGTYRVVDWANSSNTSSGDMPWVEYIPSYEIVWGVDPESPADIDVAVGDAIGLAAAYKEMQGRLVARAFKMPASNVLRAWLAMTGVADAISDLQDTLDKVIWYQALVNESVFNNRSMYLDFNMWLNGADGDDDGYLGLGFSPWVLPARFMVPVAMYKKVKKKYRRWGRTRHRTVKVYDGVRWAEVRFYDLNVYGEYAQVTETPGTVVQLGKPATISQSGTVWVVNFDDPLPTEIWNAGHGELTFDDVASSTLRVVFTGDMAAYVPDDGGTPTLTGEHTVVSVKVPPEHSRNVSDEKTPVTLHLKAPALPYDEEIRKKAFVEYGPFSQDRLFEVTRNGDGGFPDIPEKDRVDGWRVFRKTSRKIEDMREGIGLYDKVAFLLSVLTHEFGGNRVELINTWRSEDDQKGICTGGAESSMLSWHNYGMAAKILVYQADGITPIVDKSDDMKRLVKVARAFTEICADGRAGAPCNVVWCGRLTVNPSLFDWEFLPIGVGHKDAFRFREAVMAQKDPVKECSYVDVDGTGLASDTRRTDGKPYILRTSSAYSNAVVINGHHFVSPDRIANYSTPEDIVLYDIVEYIDLIHLKLSANGNTLGDRANMYEWKSVNDAACEQLIRYFALTNNVKSAKALIAGDFIEKYQAVEDAFYSTSPVDYVKNMLGSRYEDAYLTIDSQNDAGFISLATGKMYVKPHDQAPDNVPTVLDMHGQQRIDSVHVRRGVWRDGLFYGLDEIDIPYVESDGPVIEGYVDGKASYGDAAFLHQAVASELHAAFLEIRDMFERYNGQVMYDRFQDGPNADKFNQLENEFGAIAAQDLMDFDDMEAMLARDAINGLADRETNGELNGVTVETGADGERTVSIYEKVVNNAQLAGMRKALKTSERMHVTDRGGGLTPGEIYRAFTEGRAPGASDLMSGL